MPWQPPSLTLQWGAYFKPDAADELQTVQTVIQAKNEGIITQRTAVEKVQRIFNIEGVTEYLDQLDEEAKERQERAMQVAASMKPAAKDQSDEKVPPVPARKPGFGGDVPE